MTNEKIRFIMDAIALTALHFQAWKNDYTYNTEANEYVCKDVESNGFATKEQSRIEDWFNVSTW